MRRICLLLLFVACGDDGTSPGIDGAIDDAPPAMDASDAATPALTVASTGRVRLRAGESGTLAVTLGGAVMGPTTIRAATVPAGVAIEPMTITAGEVQLVVTAGAGAVPSTMVTTIVATDDDDARSAQTMADVRVVGAAGTVDTTYGAAGRLDIVMPDAIDKALAFEADYDFFTVEAGYFVRRRRASDGAIDPTWVQGGLLNVLDTQVHVVDANRIVIARSYFGPGATIAGDVSLHTPTGQRTWRNERPIAARVIEANGSLLLFSHGAGPSVHIDQLSLTNTLTPIVANDPLDLTGYVDFAVDGAGRIVVGGETSPQAALGRLAANGQVDTSFGTQGVVELANPLASPAGASVYPVLSPGGNGAGVALVGFSSLSSLVGQQYWLVAFSATGALGSPIAITAVDPDSDVSLIAIQPDGKILVAGSDAGAGFVRRYMPAVQLDPTFAANGSLALSRVPDQIFVFPDDDRLVISTVEQIINGGTIHLTRVWL